MNVKGMLQCFYRLGIGILDERFRGFTRVLQGFSRGVTWVLQGVTMVLHGPYRDVIWMLQGYYMGATSRATSRARGQLFLGDLGRPILERQGLFVGSFEDPSSCSSSSIWGTSCRVPELLESNIRHKGLRPSYSFVMFTTTWFVNQEEWQALVKD